jgi:hypothetical protein
MKKLVVVVVLLFSFLFAPIFALAVDTPTQEQLTQQLIAVLTQLIAQLQQQIATILASQARSTAPTPITPVPPICVSNWQCGWGNCINGYVSQVAVDLNSCGLPSSGAGIACTALARQCGGLIEVPVICTPSTTCEAWSTCVNGKQTQACVSTGCSEDGGTPTSASVQERDCPVGCTPIRICEKWGICGRGQQTRICTNTYTSECIAGGAVNTTIAESQACTK